MWPLMEAGDLVGASFLPTDGQASPSDITQSLAKGARMHGAKLFEGVRVTGFDDRRTAASPRSRPTTARSPARRSSTAPGNGRARSARWPASACRCSRSSTNTSSPRRSTGWRPTSPTIRDPDRRTYFKEEVGGLVMGGYEPDPACAWTTGDVPDDFEFQLFDDDWDHFEQHMIAGARARPGARHRRHQADDQRPGKLHARTAISSSARRPRCANFFVGAGFNAFGIAVGGGAGWVLAQWVIDGEAPLDLWVVDIRRFSDLHRDRALGRASARWRPMASTTRSPSRTRNIDSGRPRIVSPLYERLKAHRAVFGSKLGWERPNWFAPEGRRAARRLFHGPAELVRRGRRGAPRSARARRHLRPVVLRQISS